MSGSRSRKRAQSSIVVAWLLCLLPCPLEAQWKALPDAHAPTLKVDVDLVTLNFSIRDETRRTVANVHKRRHHHL